VRIKSQQDQQSMVGMQAPGGGVDLCDFIDPTKIKSAELQNYMVLRKEPSQINAFVNNLISDIERSPKKLLQ
jgi:hypothetical protein